MTSLHFYSYRFFNVSIRKCQHNHFLWFFSEQSTNAVRICIMKTLGQEKYSTVSVQKHNWLSCCHILAVGWSCAGRGGRHLSLPLWNSKDLYPVFRCGPVQIGINFGASCSVFFKTPTLNTKDISLGYKASTTVK